MEIREVTEQPTLMVRLVTPVAKISDIMGEVYGEIGTYVAQKGIALAGAPYAMYYNMDMEALDLEMGFPVTEVLMGSGRITAGKIPGGKIATTIHTGPYDTLEKSYIELMGFVKEKGLAVHEQWMYEYYLNSPMEVAPQELQTQICYIIK
mgnify:CR=1 FL=1